MIQAFVLALTQALTEFLPVSSSGHLFFMQRMFLRMGAAFEGDALSFFVFLHLATLGAVCVFFAKSIPLLFNRKLLPHIVFMTAVTGVIALCINFLMSSWFENKYFLAVCFLINAVILLYARSRHHTRQWQDIAIRDSLIIGLLQGIAFLPGISRSGITITGFIKRGFKREEAFKLSFIIAIPVIIGAFAMEYHELPTSRLSAGALTLGFICAFAGGIAALAILKKAVIMEKIRNFSWYCFTIAILTLFT